MADCAWTAKSVASHFEEASRTLQLLPPSQRQVLCCCCPEALTAGRKTAGSSCTASLSSAAIASLDRAIVWSGWINQPERHLVWSRAARVPWKRIAAEHGCDRTTAWRYWHLALTQMAGQLNAQ